MVSTAHHTLRDTFENALINYLSSKNRLKGCKDGCIIVDMGGFSQLLVRTDGGKDTSIVRVSMSFDTTPPRFSASIAVDLKSISIDNTMLNAVLDILWEGAKAPFTVRSDAT